MDRYIFVLLVSILSLLLSEPALAEVLIQDARSNVFTSDMSFDNARIPTGSGDEGDYELIVCGVTNDGPTQFSPPFPDGWTELDNGPCGRDNCTLGLWGRFTDDPASEDIICNWSPDTSVFAAGSFRYRNVDPVDPIIDVACDSGFDFAPNVTAIAPSIETEPGSQVAVFFVYRNVDDDTTNSVSDNDNFEGLFFSAAALDFANVFAVGFTILFPSGGATPVFPLDTGTDSEWRACTVALRMAPDSRNVPALSEWGLIGFAAVAGIAGLWYLGRRTRTA